MTLLVSPNGLISRSDAYINNGNNTSEYTLYSQTIEGGVMSMANAMRFAFYLNFSTLGVLPGNLTLRVKYGSAVLTLGGGALALIGGRTAAPVRVSGVLVNRGTTNAQFFTGEMRQDTSGLTLIQPVTIASVKPAIDSSIDQTFALTAQFSVGNVANTITLDFADVTIS